MKNSKTRTTWSTIAFLAVTGLCLAFVGFFMGADTNGIYFSRNGLNINSRDSRSIKDGEIRADSGRQFGGSPIKETNIGVISDIQIYTLSAEIRFIEADDYGFEAYFEDNAEVDYSYEDGKLIIEQQGSFGFSVRAFEHDREYIDIYLPYDAMLDSVDIATASGKLDIGRLNCDTFYAKQASGSTNISHLAANEVKIKCASGEVTIEDSMSDSFDFTLSSGKLVASKLESEELTVTMSSGSADLSGTFDGDISLKVSSGKMAMLIYGNEEDYNRDLSVSSGRVMINGQRAIKGTTNFGADNDLYLTASSGNIDIMFQQ